MMIDNLDVSILVKVIGIAATVIFGIVFIVGSIATICNAVELMLNDIKRGKEKRRLGKLKSDIYATEEFVSRHQHGLLQGEVSDLRMVVAKLQEDLDKRKGKK